jgi:uncharacterized protein
LSIVARGHDLDLSAIPVIDGHCHSIAANFRESSVEGFLRIFTEAADPGMAAQHSVSTLTYRRAMRDLATFLTCTPTPASILVARRQKPDYLTTLCRDASIQGMLVDTGYPPGTLGLSELQSGFGCRVAEILRLETLAEALLLTATTFSSFEERFRQALTTARSRGAVALKSIIAYRAGLAVKLTPPSEAREAFQQLRTRLAHEGRIRLTAKPILDYCVQVALEEAKRLELPIQFHTGLGDPDIDLLTANPALLRPIIAQPSHAEISIIVLHMGYPYVREAAFLASIYPQVYVDISLAAPLLRPALPDLLRELLALAPATKILYGSDAHSQPEMFWLGAHYARWALGVMLKECIADGTLTDQEAWEVAERICYRNAFELYRLDPSWWPGGGVSDGHHISAS